MDNTFLERYFLQCRSSIFNAEKNSFLLSKIAGTSQETDLSAPVNCEGYGRIRHFKRLIDMDWIPDPLPIDPACTALNIPYVDVLEAQVFQVASCNVHCWYCFVPDELKYADGSCSDWFTPEEIVRAYLSSGSHSKVIDLSGGNPELVPEWVIGMMKVLDKYGLSDKVYLWSDDTLTTDYTFRFLPQKDIEYMRNYKMYGKVCCFKGFDAKSFSFNCNLPEKYFDRQFEHFSKYLDLGIDIYGYVTLTSDSYKNIGERISYFFDRLQKIHPLLPLRIVPLKISVYSPVKCRITQKHSIAIEHQYLAIAEWNRQLQARFNNDLLSKRISEIKL